MITVEIPLRLRSSSNLREHWATRAKRVRQERLAARVALAAVTPAGMGAVSCARVKLTRLAPRQLDGDNLQSAFKGLRDGVADVLCVDDGDPRVMWEYAQQKSTLYGVRIEVDIRLAPRGRCRLTPRSC